MRFIKWIVFIYSLIFSGMLLWAQESFLILDDFESENALKSWKALQGSQIQFTTHAKEGAKALDWKASKGSRIAIPRVPKTDWREGTFVEFWIFQEEGSPKIIELQLKQNARSMFWRKIVIQGVGWQKVTIPLYQFARKNGPFWKQIQTLVFYTRDDAHLLLDQFYVSTQKTPESGTIEPDAILCQRAFPQEKNLYCFKNDYFRILTNTDIDGNKLLSRCDDLYKKFKTHFAFTEELEVPLTLLIFQEREHYVQFCGETTQHVYGLNLSPTLSDGRTFFDYCASSYLEKFKEDRPVYFHELTHQLVSKYLGFDVDQYWIQEGLATLFQLEMMSEEGQKVRQFASKMKSQKNRVPLSKLDAQYLPPTSEYVQMMTLVEFLRKGKYASSWTLLLQNFETGASLEKAVQQVLKIDLKDFEAEWIAFCQSEYAG